MEYFLAKQDDPISNTHTNYWESLQIAKTFLNLGYTVDVISYHNEDFTPEKRYSFFIGARTNFHKFAKLLNADCIKIAHLDMAHWLFNNSAAYNRYLALQQRRGIAVMHNKMCEPNWAIEYADYATVLGNQFTLSTYQYAKKQIFLIPISTCATYPWPAEKNFDSCRRNFVWFGSGGLTHKGLDLALEVFAEMPDYHLTVCGPIKNERDFETCYYRELYQTKNIHTVGWIDVNSHKFVEIMNNSVGLIYPSCSEGQSGSVVNCLHGGLIPIISYQSGIDVNDFGVILNTCSSEEIKSALQKVSNLSSEMLRQMARKSWEYARANHTRERFAEEYSKAILEIIARRNKENGHLNSEKLQ
ncbi:MAG: glycosyl transferase family 1 [Candidatus Brocadia sp. WS118]|nr:MAG: glycosyl transferase family 1 [Candidatus Brocadia sp. WS118]